MITLKRLEWSNCFSYGDENAIDLQSNKITQLIGSNGMGKSSIPLILEEVLYNKNSKGIKKADIPNRLRSGGYSIALDFSDSEHEYRIEVDRKSTIKVKLLKDGEDISSHKSTDTFKTIEEIIGRPFKTASQLIYQSTTSSLQFLTAPDTARKKFFIELFDLEAYVSYFEQFKGVAKELDKEVSILEAQLNTVQSWIDKANKTSLEKKDLEPEPELDIAEDEAEIKELEKEVSVAKHRNKQINANNRVRKQLEEFDTRPIKEAEQLEVVDVSDLLDERGSLKAEQSSANNILKKLKGLKDTCPTCLQDIDTDAHQKMIKDEEEKYQSAASRLEEIASAIQEAEAANQKIEKGKKKKRDLEELHRSLDKECPTELIDTDDLNNRIKELNRGIQRQRAELDRIRSDNATSASHNARVDTILEQIDEHKEELNQLDSQVGEKRDELATVEILKKSFSTSGLIAYKIENLVKDLEETTNAYLAELSDGRFSLGFVVDNDKLNVSLTDNGEFIQIPALSSGELARVNTATLLAIRKLMSSLSKANINVLFLDEVINVLDVQGREKLVEVLMGEPELNTFIVSHGWTHPLLEKIEIVKTDGISELVKDNA